MNFFFNDTATTEIYTLSLPDALPIFDELRGEPLLTYLRGDDGTVLGLERSVRGIHSATGVEPLSDVRSEEHTSELQSRQYLVCRLLLEKKKQHSIILASSYLHSEHFN